MAGATCESCGTSLQSGQLRGLCPRCLLALGQTVGKTGALALGEQVGEWIGRYRLLERIGEGGMGVVYVAEQQEPIRRRVALKIIKLGLDTKSVVARFEAERQVLAVMDHPNIAKVLDAGATETGRPYFVMELVRGIRITAFCDQNKLSTRERLELFIQVCHAIQHAHQKGIIHRDIKPSNILVTLHDGVPVPKVIDFGIAKATQPELTEKTVYTQFQQFIGTPAYMSPEQAELSGLDIDTRSDIYSLGVLLYELLTKSTPFDTTELVEAGLDGMRKIIRERPPVPPSTRVTQQLRLDAHPKIANRKSQIENDLDWIAMKCLEKDRRRRYETANALAMDIDRHLNHEPVLARAPSVGYRLQKSFQRNKLAFSAAGAIGLALALGVVASSWQAIRATQARRGEAAARQRAEASDRESRHLLYVANMHLMQEAGEQNNAGRLRELLEQTAAYPARGFEWYYWQRQMHLELQTLRGHSSNVCSVAFSPDGPRIVTGSLDGTAKVWEAASGKELLTLNGHTPHVHSVAFSPDGQRIVTGGLDGMAKVWDAATGKPLFTLRGHPIASVAFSPDGQRIAAAGGRTAKVWDAASGKLLLTLKGQTNNVPSVAFSPDGQRIVTGSCDPTAKVWDAASGKELLILKGEGAGNYVLSVAFSPDGQRIVTGSLDHTARVWDAGSSKLLLTLTGHSGPINSVVFSPEGRRIVTGSGDQTAKLWDAASGKLLLTCKGHTSDVLSAAFSPDGQRIVTGSGDLTAKVWEVVSQNELLTLSEITSGVAFSPDGRRIVTGSFDGTARVWEAASGKELLAFKEETNISSVAFSPDGRRIVTGSSDQTGKVWDAASGKRLLTLKGHSREVTCVTFSPDGQRIATGSYDGTAQVWDAASGKPLLTLKADPQPLAFSPDGQRIATTGGGTAQVWDLASGKLLLTLNANTQSMAFSPDGQRIITGLFDGTVTVWEAVSGTKLLSFKGHSGWINCVAFSPDGQRIVTDGSDQTAKVWEAASGKELLTLKGHTSGIWSVAFSPDGQRVVTGSLDHTARVWEAATAQQVAAWVKEEKEAAERVAVLRREQAAAAQREQAVRAQDPGAIKQ